MTRQQKGFTLIELLIVVAIIGILAAIAIPNLLTAMQRSKQKRTMADMKTIATAWEARATDYPSYSAAGTTFTMPGAAVSYTGMSNRITPTYIKSLPANDGWGNPFTFSTDSFLYGIRSPGKDNVYSGSSYTAGPTNTFADDIVFSNGSFVCYPDGVQVQ